MLLAMATPAWSLVPLEGLLLGNAPKDIQFDPLALVFQRPAQGLDSDRYVHGQYVGQWHESESLVNSCENLGQATYISPEAEAVARRSIVATLQYLALDVVVKGIGGYGQTLQLEAEEFSKLATNLVNSSCSPNISVYGHKLLLQNLIAAYQRNGTNMPALPGHPFAPEGLREKAWSREWREREFHYSLELFRGLCSWGGETSNYRLLPPLLANPLIMSMVHQHLRGQMMNYDARQHRSSLVSSTQSVQVLCENMLCRQVPSEVFQQKFPRMLGSTGIGQDLARQWCHHFRYQAYQASDSQHPTIREWIKRIEPEDERRLVGQMIALLTGVTDLAVGVKHESELAVNLRLPLEARWDQWANHALAGFSKNLLFEEPLEIRVAPSLPVAKGGSPFGVDLSVTMGELDRLVSEDDKLRLEFSFELPRSWLRWVRQGWDRADHLMSPQERENFLNKVASQLRPYVESKKKYFPTPLYGEGLEQILAGELVGQLERYAGQDLNQLGDHTMVNFPVRFHYGVFALSYMRYKAELVSKNKVLDL